MIARASRADLGQGFPKNSSVYSPAAVGALGTFLEMFPFVGDEAGGTIRTWFGNRKGWPMAPEEDSLVKSIKRRIENNKFRDRRAECEASNLVSNV